MGFSVAVIWLAMSLSWVELRELNDIKKHNMLYGRSWAVQMQRSITTTQDVFSLCKRFGLKHQKVLSGKKSYYYVLQEKPGKAPLQDEENKDILKWLSSHPKVLWVEQLKPRDYSKRAVSYNDPFWRSNGQEYLKTSSNVGHNVEACWEKGFTGKNVTVAVIDDGLKYTHEEFKGRYVADLSYDYVDNDNFPDTSSVGHGTRCAGIIAAMADNDVCGVGVAYDANIAAIRLIHNVTASDPDEAKAFFPFPGHTIDVFSNSWGPPDNSFAIGGPKMLSQRALRNGVTQGRNGLGSIYVFSAGNGRVYGDSCSFNGYVNSIYTIGVGAVVENGKISDSSEACSAIMTSAYSHNLKTASSSSDNSCDGTFGQTSGATAMISGMIALALQANPFLTWRDVQHLVVRSSNPAVIHDQNAQWVVNKAGFKVSDRVGFGVLDALMLVKKSQTWNISVPEQIKCVTSIKSPLYFMNATTFYLDVSEDVCSSGVINFLEHVQIRVDLQHFRRGVTILDITSPSGTKSRMLHSRQIDALAGKTNYTNLTTTSVTFWGEPSRGKWTISFQNGIPQFGSGKVTLFDLSLILYGTKTTIGTPEGNDGKNVSDHLVVNIFDPIAFLVMLVILTHADVS